MVQAAPGMTRRERAISAGRDVTIGLGVGLGAALLVAAAVAGWAAAAAGWWDAGYVRLFADSVSHRFDRSALLAAALGIAAVSALRLVRVRGGRRAVRAALAVLVVVGGLRALVALDAWHASRGPNVLLVSIDTLRADHLGAYGSPLPTSPTIDRRLAGEGVTFETVYSQSPKTTPSHMTMLTSLYPCVHGVELWDTNTPGRVLNPAVHTLAEVLKNAGWATAAFTGGTNVHRARGFGQGFDVYKHGNQLSRATEWIRRHRRRKWFVFFHTYEVHDPYVPPAELVARFDPDYRGPVLDAVDRLRAGVDGWGKGHKLFWASVDATDPRAVRFVERLYDAGIRHMDDATLAPLLDLLERLGLASDTLVVFTSDHGEAFGEHGRFLHDDLHAGTLHVPLILRFPGRLPPGRRVRAPARLLDVMPTILALLGVPAAPAAEGRSLLPFLGDGRADAGEDHVVSEHDNVAHGRRFASVRRGPLTYIVDGPAETLFDVVRDPREDVDVAADRPADVDAMRAVLARWREECRSGAARLGARGDGVLPDDATRRRLRALGYVE
jgi:arylsulfatase A-like enzyme